MSGDFVIGIIVFLILVIINFLVITKARPALPRSARASPSTRSRQADGDRRRSVGGLIDEKVASSAAELEEESAFFGSMDGARSSFAATPSLD